jgi:subtilisin family serine protease
MASNNIQAAVANMSFSFPYALPEEYWHLPEVIDAFNQYPATDPRPLAQAIHNLLDANVTVVASAGNTSNGDCNSFPAGMGDVFTVGATTINDQRWYVGYLPGKVLPTGSNFGACVDLYAPGESIISASNSGDGATEIRSGTSMAAPYVAGIAASYLETNVAATPVEVGQAINDGATTGVLSNLGTGSYNCLVDSKLNGIEVPPGNGISCGSPPSPSFSSGGSSSGGSSSGGGGSGTGLQIAWLVPVINHILF